jgi:hypothetical protein
METQTDLKPFDNCPALDGYHCQTNSLAKIYHFHNCPLSEDMVLGLGAGMGFVYWQQKGAPPFVGGRGNVKTFFQDLGDRTSVQVEVKTTSSERKAENALLQKLGKEEPLMVYADMAFLPWFELPEGYHFGGHTFVVCGFDGKDTALASDMDQKATGLKKGFYYPITLAQLRKARNSPHRPYPPKNTYLEFEFSGFRPPTEQDIYSAISQTAEAMLHPPISNLGVKGIRRTGKEILKWPDRFEDEELRLNLFNVYVFIEIGGTGGGCFRYMYARFLKEAAALTANPAFEKAAAMLSESGQLFTEVGMLFADSETASDLDDRIAEAKKGFDQIAAREEEAFHYLAENLPQV